jgi:mRNA interferase HicA
VTSSELRRFLTNLGATFLPAKGGHMKVYLRGRMTIIPMHGKGKEIGTGLLNKIKMDLGLK